MSKIEIGDIVKSKMSGMELGVVTCLNKAGLAWVMCGLGLIDNYHLDDLEKTGRHIDAKAS